MFCPNLGKIQEIWLKDINGDKPCGCGIKFLALSLPIPIYQFEKEGKKVKVRASVMYVDKWESFREEKKMKEEKNQ